MACFKPLKGYRQPSGKLTFDRKNSTGALMEVPCGICIGCRLDYSQSWAIRCLHESSLYDDNCFLTLTYEDSQIPSDLSLNKSHFQKFMKRLRERVKPRKIRFYHCGEYGTKYSRPHYHALIFNYDFPDKRLWSYGQGKTPLYRSAQLESLWEFGWSTISDLTYASAAYAARYSIKKIRGTAVDTIDPDTGLKPYERIDFYGEITTILPEYATMSTGNVAGQGIGGEWYAQFKDDVFPDDFVIYKGKRCRTPNYYRKLLEKSDPSMADSLREIRAIQTKIHAADNTPARLAVREKCKQAQIDLLKRDFENGTSTL